MPTPAPASSTVAPGRISRPSKSSCRCRYSPYQAIDSPTSASSGRYCTMPTRVSATALKPGRCPASNASGVDSGRSGGTACARCTFAVVTAASRTRSCSATFTRSITSSQSPRWRCRNKRIVGYQGLSSRPSSQRKSAGCATISHTGLPSAPARCATAVSTHSTRSN